MDKEKINKIMESIDKMNYNELQSLNKYIEKRRLHISWLEFCKEHYPEKYKQVNGGSN